jgi:hypothetical protein
MKQENRKSEHIPLEDQGKRLPDPLPISNETVLGQAHSKPSKSGSVKQILGTPDMQGLQKPSALDTGMVTDQVKRTPVYGREQPVEQAWSSFHRRKPITREDILRCAEKFPWLPPLWYISYKGTLLKGAALKAHFDRLLAERGFRVTFTELPTAANQFKRPVEIEYFY